MALIASGTVATDGGSVPLLTVPQTFNDLFLTWTAASVTTAGSVGLRFNGDGGANYDYNSQGAKTPSSGPQGAGGEENGSLISIGTSDVPGAAGSCRILGYRTPNTPRRAVLAESVYYGTATPLLSNRYSFGAWRSSAPITQIQVVAFFGGGFKAGSKFTLWGV
jgi:hypothetical protein